MRYIVNDGEGEFTVHESRAEAVEEFDLALDRWSERAGDSGYWDGDAELTAVYRVVLVRQPEKEVLGKVRDLPEDEREAYDGILDEDGEIWQYNPLDCNHEIEALLDLLDLPGNTSMDVGDVIDEAVSLLVSTAVNSRPDRGALLKAAAMLVRAAALEAAP